MEQEKTNNRNPVVPTLPNEIIADIMSRLEVEDVIRCSSVCKSWYNIPKEPHFIELHLSRALSRPPSRILLQPLCPNPIHSVFFLDTCEGLWRDKKVCVDYMKHNNLYVLCTCNGLACLHSPNSDDMAIYNPVTGEHLQLPRLNPEAESSSVCLGFGPTTYKYKLVHLFEVIKSSCIKGEILTLGHKIWRPLDVPYTVVFENVGIPVYFYGTLYWLIDRRVHPGQEIVLVFDISTEKFHTIKCPSSLSLSIEQTLVRLGDSMAIVQQDYMNEFQVLKIVRANTKKGYKFYHSYYTMGPTYTGLVWSMRIMGRLSDGSFLFYVANHLHAGESLDHLGVYFPNDKEYKIVPLSLDMPVRFNMGFFVPSFVSPGAVVEINKDI